jgi:hypothetical protein
MASNMSVHELVESHDDVQRAARNGFPDFSRGLSGGRRFEIVLALFDIACGKKSRPPATDTLESDQLEPPSKPKGPVAESKLKPEPLAAYRRGYIAKKSAEPKAGYGPQTQRVRHLR